MRLGVIHAGVGRAVDDPVRPGKIALDALWIRDVQHRQVEPDDVKVAGLNRSGQISSQHAVCADDVQADVGDVHRSAAAVAVSALLAQNLGQHAVHVRAFGQHVPVSTMGGQ